MGKNNDSTAPERGARRRRPDSRRPKNDFEWDSVDDQVQEDLIEPVAAPKRKKSRATRAEHVANTLYVSNSYDDPYTPVKKKQVKTKRAEDYADFVAEVADDEIDPYAIPSYGSTRLTPSDEVLVEELVSLPERGRRVPPKTEPVEEKGNEPARRTRTRAEKKRPQASEEEPRDVVKKESSPAPKRSFLSKLKEAAASKYGGASSAGDASGISPKRLDDLVSAAKKALDASGVKPNVVLERKDKSQLETLADVVEALLLIHLSTLGDPQSSPTTESKPVVSRRGARKSDEAAKSTVENAEQESEPEPRRQRGRRVVAKESAKEANDVAESKTSQEYADYDPIAFWESIEDDETQTSAPVKKSGGKPRTLDGVAEPSLDGVVEDELKKKSSRREQTDAVEQFAELTGRLDVNEVAQEANATSAKALSRRRRGDRAEEESGNRGKSLYKFGELKLKKATLKALQGMGYSAPTPIQAGVIPTILKGVDVIGQARTGTGKTAAFMIPIVEGVSALESVGAPLAVVVAPTRELAVQVRDEALKLARYYELSILACYGGKPIVSQVEKLRQGVDILIGTPGRILDLANRGALSLGAARWVVLDEADRMLDDGFRPDVERILNQTSRSRQTLLFSATLPPSVVGLAQTYMHDPEQFDFSMKDVSAETIEQFYLTVDQDRKFDALTRLLEAQNPRQAIVFCRTKRHVDSLARRLAQKFPNVEAIHGDLPQPKRDRIMRDFREEKIKTLVATDVVGRGIDVSTVSHIVNYDIPQYCDDYVHRVGRAGRMGREGVAFTLVTAEEGSELTRVEIRINRLLERYDLPGFEALSVPKERATEEQERKPVFGRSAHRNRRAL